MPVSVPQVKIGNRVTNERVSVSKVKRSLFHIHVQMAISKGSSTKNPGNPSKSLKSSLNEKTGKLLEAAQVISNVLDTLETDAQCQLPRVLSLSRNASAVSLNASAKGLSGIASANASNENLQSRPHLTRSVVELDCKESDHPHKSNPDSIFVPAEKDFFGTAQAIKTDHRAKVSSKTKAPHQLDSPKEPELRVKDALESDLSPVNKKMDFKSIESDAAPTQSTMKMLLLEKENLQLKNQILSKSNLELSTTRKSQEQISSRADYSDENEELCRLRGIETKHHSLLRSASGPQSHIDHLATENAALKHKVSGQTMEIKSLVEQVEILRIENKKLIESDIQAKSPQKRSSVHRSMDLAAQQALLTAIEETSKTMDVKGNSGARSLLERCCKSLKSAVELTYEETSLAAFRQCLYTTKEIIAQWTMDSLGLDERLARVSAEANTIRQEAQDLVVRMDKKVTELKAENEELHGTIDGLKKDLKLAQSEKQTFQITSQAVTPAPVVPIHDTFSDKTGLESLRFENTQLKLHIDHLEGTIKDWKCENESLLRQLKEIDARPSDRLLELESILDKTQSQLDGERLCLKKAQELIKSLQVEITDMIAETAVLRAGMTSAKETPGTTSLDPTLLAKLKSLGTLKGVTPSVNIAKEVEHIFNLVQENQATLDRLTDLKSDLKGLSFSVSGLNGIVR